MVSMFAIDDDYMLVCQLWSAPEKPSILTWLDLLDELDQIVRW